MHLLSFDIYGYDDKRGTGFRTTFLGSDKKKIADKIMSRLADYPEDAKKMAGKALGMWLEHNGKTKFSRVDGAHQYDVTVNEVGFQLVE